MREHDILKATWQTNLHESICLAQVKILNSQQEKLLKYTQLLMLILTHLILFEAFFPLRLKPSIYDITWKTLNTF